MKVSRHDCVNAISRKNVFAVRNQIMSPGENFESTFMAVTARAQQKKWLKYLKSWSSLRNFPSYTVGLGREMEMKVF